MRRLRAAPEGGSEAAVETSAPEPVDLAPEPIEEVTPVEVEEEIEVPEVFDWNGEFDSLRSADWLHGLNDNQRDAILKGVEDKYQNWQRGYTGKYQELAKQRREADDMLKEVRDQEVRVQRWLNGDINPMVEKQREVDEMKVAHKAALRALRREAEEAHEKAVRSHGAKMEEAARERDKAVQEYKQVQTQMETFENQQTESQVDALEKWLIKEHNDIYDNDEAFDEFCDLARANVPPERAIQMLRGIYPKEVVAPEPEPVRPKLSGAFLCLSQLTQSSLTHRPQDTLSRCTTGRPNRKKTTDNYSSCAHCSVSCCASHTAIIQMDRVTNSNSSTRRRRNVHYLHRNGYSSNITRRSVIVCDPHRTYTLKSYGCISDLNRNKVTIHTFDAKNITFSNCLVTVYCKSLRSVLSHTRINLRLLKSCTSHFSLQPLMGVSVPQGDFNTQSRAAQLYHFFFGRSRTVPLRSVREVPSGILPDAPGAPGVRD